MKKLFGCVSVCQIFLPVILLLCTITGVKANNIRVEGKTRVVSVVNDTVVIEVTLRWDNSWRDDFNWDAAWVFFKFKKRGMLNPWQHAYLSSSGHVLSTAAGNEGGGYAYMVGANVGKVNGLYVMRNGISEGNVSVRLQAKWPLNGTGLTKSDFGDALNRIYVAVHAIEMVYVPYGAYYLGDASSYKSFAVGDTAAVVIDSESALTLSAKNGMPNVSLAASYPNGYAGFYVMKYETSQEQYVEFLNSLTLDQQKARVANNNFSTMKRGDYVFGDIAQPSCRNGIVFIEQRKANTPVVFGNNLNPNNDLFSTDDGQTLACNYMSIEDMIAYCSWSGLRPMSELEYEKACRRFYPQVPDKGEYAWNTNTGINALNGLGDLAYLGDEREVANNISRNVNSGTTNNINGPVRCGMFGTSATNQSQSGATYWGVMEMSGNLKELCANVNYTNLDGSSSGTGVYNPAYWSTAVGSYGVRGGGFNSTDDLLRTSDRTEAMNYFSSITQRDSTVGFRLVRTLSGCVTINPGTISLNAPLCPEVESTIAETAAAGIYDMTGDFPLRYIWSYSIDNGSTWTVIAGANANTLRYSVFEAGKTYIFKRTVVCALGEASTQTTAIAASASTVITVQPEDVINAPCNLSISVTAIGTGLTYQWEKDGGIISGATFATYSKNPTVASDAGKYVCKVTGTCGMVASKEINVFTGESEDGVLTDSRDGQTYRARKMPDGHWWMIENLRFGMCDNNIFATYLSRSVQNQIAPGYWGVCIASTQPGAGHLYNWQAAMNSADAVVGTAGNPSGNVNGNSSNQWQGICPEGWHLPSGGSTGELQKLYEALCNTVSKIYPGTNMFEGVLGGYSNGAIVDGTNRDGYYWSSTWGDYTNAYHMLFVGNGVNPQRNGHKQSGLAVRCVKNY